MSRQLFAGMNTKSDNDVSGAMRAGGSLTYHTSVRVACTLKRVVIGSDDPPSLLVEWIRVVRFGTNVTLSLNIGEGPVPLSAFRVGFDPEQVLFGHVDPPIVFDMALMPGDVVELQLLNIDSSGHVGHPGLVVEV